MPRTPSGTSVVTCSIGQVGTSFVRRFDLHYVRLVFDMTYFLSDLTRVNRFLKILNSLLLAAKACTLLMMEPA